MKANQFFPVLLLAISCGNHSSLKTDSSRIIGVYVTEGKSEFSQASDTILISVYNKIAKTYIVKRNTGFNRILNGQLKEREFKSETIIAEYDEKDQQLKENKTGRIFSFPEDNNELLLGSVHYKKIK